MSHIDQKTPPRREERLNACIAHGGTICEMAGARGKKSCLQNDGDRSFTQGSICLLLPALAILNSLPDNVVLQHSAVGCGSCSHSQNANVRMGSNVRQGKAKDGIWLSTAMNETDVITGGEEKLEQAIIEADRRYKPFSITVVSGCAPGIIGDDIYDAVYHGIGRTLLRSGEQSPGADGLSPFRGLERLPNTVNLMNVSSMGRVDEVELERLLETLGLDVNVFPVFSHPESMVTATQAALSISTCPTHDDYFLSYLEERFGVPALIHHMPIGIENTSLWLRDVAARFGREEQTERLIAQEEGELRDALAEFRPLFEGKKVKPDLFLGHANGNGTAAKLGIPTHVIYNTGLAYIGYKGVYEIARRLHRQLSNPIYNRKLADNEI